MATGSGSGEARCRDCGVEIPPGTTWCHACGQTRLQALERRARSRPAWDGGDVLLVLAGIAGLVLLIAGASSDEPSAVRAGTWLLSLPVLWLVVRSAVLSALVAWDRRRTSAGSGEDGRGGPR